MSFARALGRCAVACAVMAAEGAHGAPPPLSTPARGLAGVVSSAAGVPIAGAFVTARSPRSGIETTVYSDAAGRFALPDLAEGAYEVTARQYGYAPARRAAASPAPSPLEVKLAAAAAALPEQLPTSSWLSLLPDGDMKREFLLNCATCHEIQATRLFKDGRIRDERLWREAIAAMRGLDAYAVIPPDFDDAKYAGWLAAHLTADAVKALAAPPPPDAALAARVTITEYPVPLPDELLHDVVVGPDKRVWVTAFWHGQMWALDPQTGAVDRHDVNARPETAGQVRAMKFDAAGALWIVLGATRSVVRLDPASRKFDTFPVGMYAHDIDVDAAGRVWLNDYFSKPERIGRLDPRTGEVEFLPLRSTNLTPAQGLPLPYGMQIDARGRLWSTQLAANTLARHDVATGEGRLFAMPSPNSGPRRTALGADGSLWIAEFNTGRLTRFDPRTERFDSIDLGNAAAGCYDAEVDPRSGVVWVTGSLDSSVFRVDPRTREVERIPLPTEPAYTRHLAIDPDTGDLWSAYSSLPAAKPKIVRVRYRPRER